MAGGARAGTSASGRGVAPPRGLRGQIAAGTGAGMEELLLDGSLGSIHRAIVAKKISVSEIAKWYLARIEALDRSGPKLNAIRTIAPDALDLARQFDNEIVSGRIRGPLHGIPIVLKDNILTGDGMTACSRSSSPRRIYAGKRCDTGAPTSSGRGADHRQDEPYRVCRLRFRCDALGLQRRRRHGEESARLCRLRARPWLERGIGGGGCFVADADRNRQRDAELDSNSCVRVFSFRVQAECWNGQPGWRGSAGTEPGFARSACTFGRRRSAAHVSYRRRRLPR